MLFLLDAVDGEQLVGVFHRLMNIDYRYQGKVA